MRKPDIKLAEKRKKQILDAASRGFIKSGFHNTGMQEICKLAGLSPGAVYRYFASKEDIIEAIVTQEQHEIAAALEAIAAAKQPKIALLDFVESFTGEISKPEYQIMATEIMAEASRNKKIAKIIVTTEKQSLDLLCRLLQEEASNGKIQLSFSAKETAQTILSLAYGFGTQTLLNPKASRRKNAQLVRKLVAGFIS